MATESMRGIFCDVEIERRSDLLIIRAANSELRWPKVAIAAGMGLWGGVMIFASVQMWSIASIVPLAFAVLSVVAIVHIMSPRYVTTSFDLPPRVVVYAKSARNRPPETKRYSFDKISGVEVGKKDESYGCEPAIAFKARAKCSPLVTDPVSDAAAEKLVEAIRAATGLSKLGGRSRR